MVALRRVIKEKYNYTQVGSSVVVPGRQEKRSGSAERICSRLGFSAQVLPYILRI